MSTKRKGRKETKQEPQTQYRVIDTVSLADLENIHTRKRKYPTSSSWAANLGRCQEGEGREVKKSKRREITQYSIGVYLN